jgi:hypothetical protein
MNAKAWKQPIAYQGSNNTYGYIGNESKPAPVNELTGQPAGDQTDDDYGKETFIRDVHDPDLRLLEAHDKATGYAIYRIGRCSPFRASFSYVVHFTSDALSFQIRRAYKAVLLRLEIE